MNTDQQTRLEIMKALEKEFPDRLLEDLIDVARYVEGGGIEQDSAAKSAEEASDIPTRRAWARLGHIPDDVRAATDADGDVIRRVAVGDRLVWKFEAEGFKDVAINDNFGPFIEVLP